MATSKVKKIETPIDQRETFVSLQTNMADADGATMEQKLRALYQIQQTDTKIDKIYLLRGELPLEVQDLEDEIEGLKTRISRIQSEIAEIEARNAQCRQSYDEAQTEINKYTLQRDNVKNNREYDSITKEIEYQELDQQLAQKRIKENNFEIEDKQKLVAEARSKMENLSISLQEKKQELDGIIEETAKEEEELLKQKGELVAQIADERMLVAYNKVRSNAHNHLAVVTVQRGACGGCFNKIPPQRSLDILESKKIIVCEYCGRILVNPDFDKKEE